MEELLIRRTMLSTFDNPFNPFDEYREWLLFDIEKGYNCPGTLSRFAYTSQELSEEEYALEIERAIDEIVQYDYANVFIKVIKEEKQIETQEQTAV